MGDAVHRIEHVVRELTIAEADLVRARRDAWHAMRARRERGPGNELLGALVVAAGTAAFGAWRGNVPVLLCGVAMTAFIVGLIALLRRRARRRLAAARGPWDPPEGGWRVRETRVLARSVVGTVSGDEDYAHFLLFEIPGGEWLFLDPGALPPTDARPGEDLVRAELVLTSLSPDGMILSAEGKGAPLPHRGARGRAEDYAADVDAGFVWRPDETMWSASGDGTVPEERLPEWVRR